MWPTSGSFIGTDTTLSVVAPSAFFFYQARWTLADSSGSYTVYNMSLALYTRAVDGYRTLRTRTLLKK